MLSFFLLSSSSVSLSFGSNLSPSDCSWLDSKYGVEFNYFALSLESGGQLPYYQVIDSIRDYANDPIYTYYFNLCAPVLAYPENGNAPCERNNLNSYYTYCESDHINISDTPHKCEENPSERVPINGKAFAYQVKNNNEECYPLSSSKSSANDAYIVSLYDELDPTQGISITYLNGAWADDCGANREFKVNLKCEDDASTVPKQSDVVEFAKCKYELTLYTMHGCPSGCAAYANSLCAAQGLCGYDFATNRSHCFCYWSHFGSACEQTDTLTQFTPTDNSQSIPAGVNVETFVIRKAITETLSGQVVNKMINVTYDLRDVHNFETVYQINDTAAADLVDYQFYFNIGGSIDSNLLPDACHNVLKPCSTLNNLTQCISSTMDTNKLGFAYRYTRDVNDCILLATQVQKPWLLYDNEDNPAHGVTLEYENGSYSVSDQVNCGIKINLICPDTRLSYIGAQTGIILDKSEVIHHGKCQYEASFATAFVCPSNCITKHKNKKKKTYAVSVCSANGMCVADPAIGFVRCVCDEAYYGNDCSELIVTSSSSSSSTHHHSDVGFNIAIAIISILLIAVAVAVAYLYLRNKTLEKYAVPILDDHEQIEPQVPDYSDSDSDHFHNRKNQEMITMKMTSYNTKGASTKKQSRFRKHKNAKYQAHNVDFSDDDLSDDPNIGPSAYLAANQDDDSDSDATD